MLPYCTASLLFFTACFSGGLAVGELLFSSSNYTQYRLFNICRSMLPPCIAPVGPPCSSHARAGRIASVGLNTCQLRADVAGRPPFA